MTSSTNKPGIADAYDRWAETYDADPNPTREMATAVLRQLNWDLSERDVIEIGCGTGHNTEWIAEHARRVIALDFSEAMLQKAKARLHSSHVQFLYHDIRLMWPIAAASVDFVIVMLVLEHIENLKTVFAEAARTLRVGGGLFLCELHPMRQVLGRQAEFRNPETGKQECITAYLHDVSEYLNTGLCYGFELVHMGEWRDTNTLRSEMPRLLSLQLRLLNKHST
ncbi:MAG: class I SAM-dependent methyltransferase [Anaerolineae bacterium]|nr:class I SAM-dependent methyltransferase [Anaerolineae bacterium]